MKYAAGLDGGGTKTAVTIVDDDGRIVHTFQSGAINYNGQHEDAVRRSFREILATLANVCGGLHHCMQIGIGAAGVSNPTVVDRITSTIREYGYSGGLLVTGDHETALFGALEQEYGIILIAGTGSICYGRNESGSSHRAGGFGHLIDDEGSAYSIGRDLLSAVVRVHDGRASGTVICGMVYERLQVQSVGEIIRFVYDRNRNKQEIAALAPILSEACALGDETALRIARQSAASLFDLVVPVAEKLSLQQGTLAMAGGVLLHNTFVQSAFVETLGRAYPQMKCITARQEASAGAAWMALNEYKSTGFPGAGEQAREE